MDVRVVATARAPQAIGPYSQALVAGGFVFSSGQIALDPATGQLVGDDAASQCEQVISNLEAVLAEAGSSLGRVVKSTIFLADMADFAAVNEVYGRRFGAWRPARSTVEVARLPKDARVEIEVVALAG